MIKNKCNKVEISVFISEQKDIVNKFNDDTLSNELSNYIYEECEGYPINSEFQINIETAFPLTDKQKNIIVDLIHANYGILVRENLIYQKKKKNLEILLFIIGFVFVLSSHLIGNIGFLLFDEVILIIGWVFIWEFAYSVFFHDIKRKIEINRYKKLAKCKVHFLG